MTSDLYFVNSHFVFLISMLQPAW